MTESNVLFESSHLNSDAVFGAPWGTSLKCMTGLCIVLLVGIPIIGIFTGPTHSIYWILGMIVMPLAMLLVSIAFIIRGYTITKDTLLVHRLGWNSRIELSNLISATVDPAAMEKSVRTCGNGGLFCFAGSFQNKKLGPYRVFATAPKRSVILRFSDRTIVVTPNKPQAFVANIREQTGEVKKPTASDSDAD